MAEILSWIRHLLCSDCTTRVSFQKGEYRTENEANNKQYDYLDRCGLSQIDHDLNSEIDLSNPKNIEANHEGKQGKSRRRCGKFSLIANPAQNIAASSSLR